MSALLHEWWPTYTDMHLKWFCVHKIWLMKNYNLWRPRQLQGIWNLPLNVHPLVHKCCYESTLAILLWYSLLFWERLTMLLAYSLSFTVSIHSLLGIKIQPIHHTCIVREFQIVVTQMALSLVPKFEWFLIVCFSYISSLVRNGCV